MVILRCALHERLTQYNLLLLAFHAGSSPTSSRLPSFPTGVMGISACSSVREGTKMGMILVCGFGCDFSFFCSIVMPCLCSS